MSISTRVTVSRGLAPAELERKTLASIERSIGKLGREIKKEAESKAPRKTGLMESTIQMEVIQRGRDIKTRIWPTTSYAKYTELLKHVYYRHLGPASVAKGAIMPWLRPSAKKIVNLYAKRIGSDLAASLNGFGFRVRRTK